jgi:hypothetical protein
MAAEIHYLNAPAQEPRVPTDRYAAELEAKVISLAASAMVERAGSSVRAMDFAQALMMYRRHRQGLADEPAEVAIDAGNYLRAIENYLIGLPKETLDRLRHPAFSRDRGRQQQLFRKAAQLNPNAPQEAADG